MAASSAPPAAQNPLKTLREASFPRRCRLRMVSPARPPPISALASSPSTAAASPLSADARHRDDVLRAARAALSNCLSETYLDRTVPGLSSKARGKVRDIYDAEDHLVLVTTDRQSAFDRVLASIPFKGQVLNETRMVKNQRLPANILTPTTKAVDHDVPVSPDEIIQLGLMTQNELDEVSNKALALFAYGQQVALENGLILVDTKYEFGKGADGTIMLIDEVHTPDSSRYWIANSYEKQFNAGCEPENVDKVLPEAPEDLVCELAWRYIFLFETITNSNFQLPVAEEPIHDRISRNVSRALSSI
ncbi:Phosphoribosylaminoimidazole-succinocarboxamide synthase [Musa troglodytarum]|uniref:phosphoribosylaminoimidazolesuccinocarboxamide synthase n=1 Tax=Musa troglodytarum TaxID=320322 RepID=A0A9E7GET9_9LILI|nr:Phosphoribosylaminoimidazole-succinocarboxamide synthase [Musa troglodytarum]